MGRWEPDAEGRIRTAALQLFVERGYEQTTVADIAERAGLNRRTFFRYFADKREVLFDGSEQLQAGMVAALVDAPPEAEALDAIEAALESAAAFFSEARLAFARQRASVIDANPELHERELIKVARLSDALAVGLRQRGIHEADSILAAELATAVFRVAFRQWLNDIDERSFSAIASAALKRLHVLVER